MDIYSAINHVDRLLNFVKGIQPEAVDKMYQPSRDKLKYVAKMCIQVGKIISDLLQDEILISDIPTSELNDSSELKEYIYQMEATVSNLKQLISLPESHEVLDSISTQTQETDDKLTREEKHDIKVKFSTALEHLADRQFESEKISTCTQLLWKWFNNRFKSGNDPNFRYNIKRMPEWISSILMTYSQSVYANTDTAFVNRFNDWCNKLLYEAESTPYPLPYEVYQCNKASDKSSYLTLTYAVLWDILYDCGLNQLDVTHCPQVYLSDDYAYKICGEQKPELLDDYVIYKVDQSILFRCKLLGGDVND